MRNKPSPGRSSSHSAAASDAAGDAELASACGGVVRPQTNRLLEIAVRGSVAPGHRRDRGARPREGGSRSSSLRRAQQRDDVKYERRNSAASATEREELIAQDDRIDTRLARGVIGDPVAWANEYFDARAARWIPRLARIRERTDHGGLE